MGEHEIKKMITKNMLRQQVWMTDDNKFDHILKNSQKVLTLNARYEKHPYVEEFTGECCAMFIYRTYLVEGETDANFLCVRYGISCRHQTMQTAFAGKR